MEGMPPEISGPNVYPIEWRVEDPKLRDLYERAKQQVWNPSNLSWADLQPEAFTRRQRVGIAYWFSILAAFEGSGPGVFARAMIEAYAQHEEDPIRKGFFAITRDEVNHEEVCQRACETLLPGSPLNWEPQDKEEEAVYRNIAWVYHNGSRYWESYFKAYAKYSLPVLFSSFMLGEVASTTLFQSMAREARHPLFQEAFHRIAQDESRHLAFTLELAERAFPNLQDMERGQVTKQLRAGYVFLSMILYEPPLDSFWTLPADFIAVHQLAENWAIEAGLGLPSSPDRRANWIRALRRVRKLTDRYGIQFPAIPEIGIEGVPVPLTNTEGIIPAF